MTDTKKRNYNAINRQAQAAETKIRILTAAKQLFRSAGFECVTIDQLAKTAAVSSPTIYALFQSKRGVLRALMDEALPSKHHQALVEQFTKEPSPQKRLRLSAKIARQLYEAEQAAHMNIFREAGVLAPEFKQLEQEREDRRYERQKEGVQQLEQEQLLLKGLSLKQARDLLWAFTGRDLYRMLAIEQGWTPEAYEKWLGQLLIDSLLNPTPSPTP